MTDVARTRRRAFAVLQELAVHAFADVLTVKVDQGIELALSGHL